MGDGFAGHGLMVTKLAIMIRNEVKQESIKETNDQDENCPVSVLLASLARSLPGPRWAVLSELAALGRSLAGRVRAVLAERARLALVSHCDLRARVQVPAGQNPAATVRGGAWSTTVPLQAPHSPFRTDPLAGVMVSVKVSVSRVAFGCVPQ